VWWWSQTTTQSGRCVPNCSNRLVAATLGCSNHGYNNHLVATTMVATTMVATTFLVATTIVYLNQQFVTTMVCNNRRLQQPWLQQPLCGSVILTGPTHLR
jgi:hypothetical protein